MNETTIHEKKKLPRQLNISGPTSCYTYFSLKKRSVPVNITRAKQASQKLLKLTSKAKRKGKNFFRL